MEFQFGDFDRICGEEIDLLIKQRVPADQQKGWVPAYRYYIVLSQTDHVVGEIDLRIGYQESLYFGGHIGYNVIEKYRGNRYARKACMLVRKVARSHGMKELYITCNPENKPSKKTIEGLGGQLIEIADLPTYNDMYLRGEREVCVFKWDITDK